MATQDNAADWPQAFEIGDHGSYVVIDADDLIRGIAVIPVEEHTEPTNEMVWCTPDHFCSQCCYCPQGQHKPEADRWWVCPIDVEPHKGRGSRS